MSPPGDLVAGLRTVLVRRDPAKLTRLPINARFMRKEEYDRLVANIRRDGALTSVPLIYSGNGEHPNGQELILSGNHRCDAAVTAGLTEVDCMLIEEQLDKQRLIAIQLSHNAIAGEDDPATLKHLYERLDDIDWRSYSGLDDAQLELLAAVNTEGLAEANLDFASVLLTFLPAELDAARTAFHIARAGAPETWLAARVDYEKTLQALESVYGAYKIGNVATALHIILSIFEAHLTDLRDGYQDPTGEPRHKNPVGLETVFGDRLIPAPVAAVVNRAIRHAEKTGAVEAGQRWQALQVIAEAYLPDSTERPAR
jgi:hypothetical protein